MLGLDFCEGVQRVRRLEINDERECGVEPVDSAEARNGRSGLQLDLLASGHAPCAARTSAAVRIACATAGAGPSIGRKGWTEIAVISASQKGQLLPLPCFQGNREQAKRFLRRWLLREN